VTTLPIACNLPEQVLARRLHELRARVAAEVHEIRELDDGLAFRFPPDARWIRELAEIVVAERECCPFLTFELRVEPGPGPVWLHLRGPEGTRAFLLQNLGLDPRPAR